MGVLVHRIFLPSPSINICPHALDKLVLVVELLSSWRNTSCGYAAGEEVHGKTHIVARPARGEVQRQNLGCNFSCLLFINEQLLLWFQSHCLLWWCVDLFPFWLKYSCALIDVMLVSVSSFACAGVRLWSARAREREYQLCFNHSVGFQVGFLNSPLMHN